MGVPKALLSDGKGRPFVARLVRTFAAAGIPNVVVVTGTDRSPIANALIVDAPPVMPVVVSNPEPGRGQLSSLWTGLDAADQWNVEAILVTLVDVPLTRVGTVEAVVAAWKRGGSPIVRPVVGSRHGHPVLFDRSLFQELRNAPPDKGARAVVHAHRTLDVDVADEGCVTDFDTPADYAKLATLDQ